MMHAPVIQELAGNSSSKFGATVRRTFIRDANVVKMWHKQEIRPWKPSVARSIMGQFE